MPKPTRISLKPTHFCLSIPFHAESKHHAEPEARDQLCGSVFATGKCVVCFRDAQLIESDSYNTITVAKTSCPTSQLGGTRKELYEEAQNAHGIHLTVFPDQAIRHATNNCCPLAGGHGGSFDPDNRPALLYRSISPAQSQYLHQ